MVPTPSKPARGSLGYALYDAVGAAITVAGVVALPLLRRSRHRDGLDERLGRVPARASRLVRPLWIHAASVGEVLSTEPLIRELRRHRPDLPIVVSTTSWTGRVTAAERLGADAVMLLPADIGWVVRRCVRAVGPRLLVIVETEIWPALIREVVRSGAQVAFVSGRISPEAVRRYRWIDGFLGTVFRQVALFAMQTEDDAARARAIGAPPERIGVLGSLKFARDTATGPPRPRAARLPLPADRPVLVAASTQPGEEPMVLDACAAVWQAHPEVLLVLAPRRPERFAEVALLLQQRGLPFLRRSAREPLTPTTQVLLLDTLGELADAFPVARAVYVGGTMGGIGGHNVLEPAVFAKPVSFGPDTSNVAAAADALLAAGGAVRVTQAAELAAAWTSALVDPEGARRMGEAARAVVERQSAVAARTAEALLPLLNGHDVDPASESA